MTGARIVTDAPLLAAAAASGDASAWDALVELILPELCATARSYHLEGHDVVEVCRVVCVRLAQSLHELSAGNGLAWWLARAGREECARAAAQGAHRRAAVIDLRRAVERRAALARRVATGT